SDEPLALLALSGLGDRPRPRVDVLADRLIEQVGQQLRRGRVQLDGGKVAPLRGLGVAPLRRPRRERPGAHLVEVEGHALDISMIRRELREAALDRPESPLAAGVEVEEREYLRP